MHLKFSTTIATFLVFQLKKVFENSLNSFEDIAFLLRQCKAYNGGRSCIPRLALVLFLQILILLMRYQHVKNAANNFINEQTPVDGFQAMAWSSVKPFWNINIKTVTSPIRSTRKFNNFGGYFTALLLMCGDIASHPGPRRIDRPTNTPLKCLSVNARSLKSFPLDRIDQYYGV